MRGNHTRRTLGYYHRANRFHVGQQVIHELRGWLGILVSKEDNRWTIKVTHGKYYFKRDKNTMRWYSERQRMLKPNYHTFSDHKWLVPFNEQPCKLIN